MVHKLVMTDEPFSVGHLVKCMDATVKIICPEVETKLKNASLTRRTIVQCVNVIITATIQ